MENQNFENKLLNMTKPAISELKHQEMLATEIMKAKDKSAVSFWWLAIPLYLVATFIMKAMYVSNLSLVSIFRGLTEGFAGAFLFIVLPVILMIVNLMTIRQLFYLYGNSNVSAFFKTIRFHVLIISCSLFILILYFI